MLLAINAGNTNVSFALFDRDEQIALWRCATEARRTADEYAVWLSQLMALRGLQPSAVDGAILGSVVPGVTFNIRNLCRRHFGCEPLVVGAPGVDLGIRALVTYPDEVGADRLVNTVAAGASYTPPLIVVDFGTATTFDVVDAEGNYCGGVIAPGINLSLAALEQAAAKLHWVDIVPPPQVIGKDTAACMQSGIFFGYLGLVEGLVARIQAEFGAPMLVVATGGLARLYARATRAFDHVDADLTLRGLRLIYQRNTSA